MIENFEPILTALFAGILYSIIWWTAKNVDPTKPSVSFDFVSMAATVLVGVGVGVGAIVTDLPITQAGFETQLAAYGAVTAVVEKVLKTLYRKITESTV